MDATRELSKKWFLSEQGMSVLRMGMGHLQEMLGKLVVGREALISGHSTLELHVETQSSSLLILCLSLLGHGTDHAD